MNLREGFGSLRGVSFRVALAARRLLPPKSIHAFGPGDDQIGAILAINLDRQPGRWRWLQQELGRFRAQGGRRLSQLVERLPAIDARDGRETAPTADVDPIYTMGDQLFVQPDARLEECFGRDQAIRMSRQEIAVARSHVEAWKRIARGPHKYVLVLEDDVYFVHGAHRLIDQGWRAALQGLGPDEGPHLLYLSYLDAGGTAERADVTANLFRPIRGLWYFSGYVLSRSGAERLLRMMPVVGPVDLWINHRFGDLRVLALSKSALLQRGDGGSDNAYSILPYLARSGTVDAGPSPVGPTAGGRGLVLAWNAPGATDVMGMALSTLGYRVRTFPAEAPSNRLATMLESEGLFDAYVDANLGDAAIEELVRQRPDARFVIGATSQSSDHPATPDRVHRSLPVARSAVVPMDALAGNPWEPLSHLLALPVPDHAFPRGVSHGIGVFRAEEANLARKTDRLGTNKIDESPWVLPPTAWRPRQDVSATSARACEFTPCLNVDLTSHSAAFRALTETFPGNMATFEPTGIEHSAEGASFALRKSASGVRPLSSGALASTDSFTYGRFEAEIRPARGSGLVTGFFLHRDLPRQEIDVELLGSRPNRMLANVYFNPGDEGTAIAYGYRGTPHEIDLGFDATADFHTYAVEWTPGSIHWLVDGRIVHVRSRWDPTPIPHLPMRLHANLWSPRSVELAGQLDDDTLPAHSAFRRIAVQTLDRVSEICGDSADPCSEHLGHEGLLEPAEQQPSTRQPAQ
ncbi:family 16 glycosylhydrolase [Phenylobacterium ferrooxidans]|uniref:Beta-glucanase n=1 Tax=Phenylobacterium ferrooxidans TaxID=2982689 RepID=A0ABW6CLS7_9CAUL